MQIFPTIHIKNGKCYSTTSKDVLGKHNVFTSNPVKLAQIWESKGAGSLHVIDMDGILTGKPENEESIRQILDTVNIPIQFGGGLRNIKDIDHYLNLGVSRVVCGTRAVQDFKFVKEAIQLFGAHRFIVGIDACNGMIAIEGREKLYDFNSVSLVHSLSRAGVRTVIYTDVNRSTNHSGPSLANAKELMARTDMDLIFAGGIYHMNDIKAVKDLNAKGVIIAAALYEGRIDLEEAIRLYQSDESEQER